MLADLVGLHDVRVVEARGEPRLVEEHREELRVVGERRAQALDDDELVEAHRPARDREEDVGHPAAAEDREKLVLADGHDAPLFAQLGSTQFLRLEVVAARATHSVLKYPAPTEQVKVTEEPTPATCGMNSGIPHGHFGVGLGMVVGPIAGWSDQVKLSMRVVESRTPSPESHTAMRSVMSLPRTLSTGTVVVSQPVAAWLSPPNPPPPNPVCASVDDPSGHGNVLPFGRLGIAHLQEAVVDADRVVVLIVRDVAVVRVHVRVRRHHHDERVVVLAADVVGELVGEEVLVER